ncbi:hypothetical protein DY000_02049967 [Brassica cretica]|uniref:Uncharacterized protein n=1 Tax=Brassica cretica TaxID=69181 RepID=A0ABQ7F864_BRACR|nr:hypothetical protein DY000_02049967 [Brassica cretica]
MRNEETNEDMLYEDTNGGEMSDNQDPETQHNEEIYRVNIDDENRPSNEFIRAQPCQSSVTVDPIQIHGSRVQQRGRARRGSTLQRPSVKSVLQGSGSRGSKKKQSFETTLTDTMAGFREFQRQSLQQLRPNSFDQDDYDDFDVAVKIFKSMGLPNDTKFYWACINEFREDTLWRKYFIDRAENTFEEKVQFLQALSGFTRDDQYMGKRLSSGKPFGSPSSGGVHSGSPSSGAAQQWGAPPSMQQWGTPPTSHQWGTPPTSNQWGTTSNAQQWSSPSVAPQWGTTSTTRPWNSPPVAPQWGSSSNDQQWSLPPNNVQYGFSLETKTKSTRTDEERVATETSPRNISRTRKSGGLFNIWGTQRGPNLNETHQTDSEDEA